MSPMKKNSKSHRYPRKFEGIGLRKRSKTRAWNQERVVMPVRNDNISVYVPQICDSFFINLEGDARKKTEEKEKVR